MMRYIVTHRARFMGLCGPVNIPYGTELACKGSYVLYDGKRLCSVNSQNARECLAPDDDGRGKERGALIASIKETLERKDADHQKRWNKIWGSLMCKRYQNPFHKDFWVWNQAYYEAPISDLQSIARLVGAKTL